ncbi:MAG: hypothetical protein ACRD6I_06550 [Candidatus Acidiferrales bacterium]
MRMKNLLIALGMLGLLLMAAPAAQAQINSNVATVNLNATLNESITVSAAPGLVNFALIGSGVSNGSNQIGITTAWSLNTTRTNVSVYAYFASAASALSDGAGNNIPSANVAGSVNGGAFGPFTGASPFSGASAVTVANQAVGAGTFNSSRNDTLDLRIDTTGLGLPAATYLGVLNIQAQAI